MTNYELPVSSHNLSDFIDQKCRDCYSRGLVQRRIEVAKGEWRSAKLMCDCIDRNVKKRNLGANEQKKLLTRILEALKHREAQKAN